MSVKDCVVCYTPLILDEWKTLDSKQVESILKLFILCQKHTDEVRDLYFENY